MSQGKDEQEALQKRGGGGQETMNRAKWGLYFIFLLAETQLQSLARLQSSQLTVNNSWIKLSKCSFKNARDSGYGNYYGICQTIPILVLKLQGPINRLFCLLGIFTL